MDIRHYRATWPLPPHKEAQIGLLAAAIVENDWDVLFNVPCPGLPVLPEEVFAEWLKRQTGTLSVSRVRPKWRLFLRKSASSWEKYLSGGCTENGHYISLIHTQLIQIWPGERNKMDTRRLRITQALIDASRTS